MMRRLRSLFVRKPKPAPKRRTPSPKRRTPTPKRRRTSPSVRRSAALGPFWMRGNYAYRQGPLKSTF